MNTELKSIIDNMNEILSGKPWYGKSVLVILKEVDEAIVYKKPNAGYHSVIEILYHMVTWADFALHRLKKDQDMEIHAFEALDWRDTNAELHTWNNGIAELSSVTNKTIELLKGCPDTILDEKVDFRDYNFRYLLNGLMQHHIYHIGQIAYLNKILT
ncbi:MAG: DinB family protein [Chitinophagaceae bacterium]